VISTKQNLWPHPLWRKLYIMTCGRENLLLACNTLPVQVLFLLDCRHANAMMRKRLILGLARHAVFLPKLASLLGFGRELIRRMTWILKQATRICSPLNTCWSYKCIPCILERILKVTAWISHGNEDKKCILHLREEKIKISLWSHTTFSRK
jgi:hypothetical protein